MRKHISNNKGAVAILIGLLLVTFVGFVALAVDVGYLYAAKNELQNVADAAALAGARELGSIYQTIAPLAQPSFVCDPEVIIEVARETALTNVAAGVNVDILDADVVIGTWDPATRTLTPGLNFPDAVKVVARRDNALNTPVSTFFASVLGINLVDISAQATAALGGQSSAGAGDLELPVGISRSRVSGDPDDYCGSVIAFSPTTDPDACGGWTDFGSDSSVPDPALRDILNGTEENPELISGVSECSFTNGNLSMQVWNSLLMAFKNHDYDVDIEGRPRVDNDGNPLPPLPLGNGISYGVGDAVPLQETDNQGNPVTDRDGQPVQAIYPDGTLRYDHRWLTTTLVYDSDECNPNSLLSIIGFVDVEIFDIDPNRRSIRATIKCNFVDNNISRGTGTFIGTRGSVPGLVQ